MVFSQVLRILFLTFLTFFSSFIVYWNQNCLETLQTEAFKNLLEMRSKNKRDHQHLSQLVKKKKVVESLTICICISHQASQRMENTLKVDLYICSQSYFLWTLSSTFKAINIFHYKPTCSKIQFCPLPQLWKLSRHDWTTALNPPVCWCFYQL